MKKESLNPWHLVSPGNSVPEIVNSIIEIPKGSKAKYELDKSSGLLKLDRVLFSAVHYPVNYGYIPQTYSEDNDPLDILVICSIDVDPLCIIETKVLGVMHTSPHVAAFAADMISCYTYLQGKPYLVKANMLAGASDLIGGGSDKVGLGGIDFLSAHFNTSVKYWEGENNSFQTYAANDDGTDNSRLEKRFYIYGGSDVVRIVLSWLSRGNFIYDHRNDAHAIGMDFDLMVYDPSGNYVGGSSSWDNPFESVEFRPTVTGYYKIAISRFANRDTVNKLRLGRSVNYFDR